MFVHMKFICQNVPLVFTSFHIFINVSDFKCSVQHVQNIIHNVSLYIDYTAEEVYDIAAMDKDLMVSVESRKLVIFVHIVRQEN